MEHIDTMLSCSRLMLSIESISGRVVCLADVQNQSKLTRLFRMELKILNIQSEQ